jgi:hypothetical protein
MEVSRGKEDASLYDVGYCHERPFQQPMVSQEIVRFTKIIWEKNGEGTFLT